MTETINVSEGTIRRIEGLLNQASDPNIGDEERNTFMATADALMAKYRLDRAMLFHSSKKKSGQVYRDIETRTLHAMDTTKDYLGAAHNMRKAIYEHCKCMVKDSWYNEWTAVGYAEDLEYAEMMWLTVHMDFVRKIFPTWQRTVGFDENVYNLKSAGYSWPAVRDMALPFEPRDAYGPLTYQNAGSKLRSAYKRHSEKLGIPVLPGKQQPMQPDKWRHSFAASYSSTVRSRLREMARASKNAADQVAEGTLALLEDEDRVKDRFYELFEDLDPENIKKAAQRRYEDEVRRRAAMTQAERDREDREARKWANRKVRTRNMYDSKGWAAGHSAGQSVSLNNSSNLGNSKGKELS